jgi:hypothetical protein
LRVGLGGRLYCAVSVHRGQWLRHPEYGDDPAWSGDLDSGYDGFDEGLALVAGA